MRELMEERKIERGLEEVRRENIEKRNMAILIFGIIAFLFFVWVISEAVRENERKKVHRELWNGAIESHELFPNQMSHVRLT